MPRIKKFLMIMTELESPKYLLASISKRMLAVSRKNLRI